MLGQWYTSMKESRAALKAWNRGRPNISLETAQYASEHHAQYWARWAKELVMEQQLQYSPACIPVAAVVHKDFWVAVMRAHGLPNKDPEYWYPLVAVSCMEGNLSVLDAFAQVFDASIVSQWAENFTFVHPRVVGWQLVHGHTNRKNIRDMLLVKWDQSDYFARDAMTFAQGGPVMLDWVRAWVALPDTLVSPEDGSALLARIGSLLWKASAEPGVRATGGLPTLRNGHQYRKYRNWLEGSHLAAPLVAGDALRMVHAIHLRFGMESVAMDALTNRWNDEDLQDSRVCALICARHGDKNRLPPSLSQEKWEYIVEQAKNESLLMQALEWADKKNVFSLYQAALPFFRETQAREELAQSLELGDVFNDPVF